MINHLTVQGAYGRTYTSRAKVLADWDANLDFEILSVFHGYGTYVNKAQAIENRLAITFRYGKNHANAFYIPSSHR